MKIKTCLLCNSDRLEHITTLKNGWPIVKCKKCTFIFNGLNLKKKDIAAIYTEEYFKNYGATSYDKAEKNKRLAARQYLRQLMKYKPKGRLLELGCASGFLLDEAKKTGFETYGIEISDKAKKAEKRHVITQGTIKDVNYPPRFFDAIISINTLEHTLNPQDTLKRLYSMLKDKGICILSVPNNTGLGIKAPFVPEHISYFNPKTLKRMCINAGFKIINIKSNLFTLLISHALKPFKIEKKIALSFMEETAKRKKTIKQDIYTTIKDNDKILLGTSLIITLTK